MIPFVVIIAVVAVAALGFYFFRAFPRSSHPSPKQSDSRPKRIMFITMHNENSTVGYLHLGFSAFVLN